MGSQLYTAHFTITIQVNHPRLPGRVTLTSRRQDRMRLDTSFCMDSGQVKTGEDNDDTYVKMLQEVKLVTVSMAHGIAAKYPNVGSLLNGLKRLGPLALEDVRVCENPCSILRVCESLTFCTPEISKQGWGYIREKNWTCC